MSVARSRLSHGDIAFANFGDVGSLHHDVDERAARLNDDELFGMGAGLVLRRSDFPARTEFGFVDLPVSVKSRAFGDALDIRPDPSLGEIGDVETRRFLAGETASF